ncbi:PDR/VanB family oxidoreductase [Paenalcaligenes niemegkensis]|uniref:PDR/VanB family oxidoreductase n=1 Tax=Paenalcaligenes niemegkensis TaxID=2895469 RepID=UPI001EE89FB2|nr:PDR/VanB family oxidoreductase [Paenalcaligenes niemegkensis]MCQ9617455.1 PDR/VanB family oxidoreductase [Paenalcaligenes niemegkensis]
MNAIVDQIPSVGLETGADGLLQVVLRQIRYEAKGINSYEFVSADGRDLPAFTAGAHIDVHIEPGLIRQYSLCNDPRERHRYVIAVLKDPQGRGGSKRLHEILRVQESVSISVPRNHFELAPVADHAILIAGGIGITPLKSMAHALEEEGTSFELHYCTRTSETTAFQDDMQGWQSNGKLHLHLDQGNPEKGLCLNTLLADIRPNTQVYYCGPQGFMKACAQATEHWPEGTVRCEHFKAPEPREQDAQQLENGAFMAQIASTGQLIHVAANESLSDALAGAGVVVPTSCVSGLCGTCRIGYLSGDVDHQDYILGPDEQTRYLTACVSRAKTELLVLDL